jgi:hypothetical protein
MGIREVLARRALPQQRAHIEPMIGTIPVTAWII